MAAPPFVPLPMTPTRAIERLQHELALSPADVAQALKTNTRTLARWRSGQTVPRPAARRRLAELLDLHHRLRETFTTPDAAREWLHGASRYLGGLAPVDAIRVGRLDRVVAALEALDSGVFV